MLFGRLVGSYRLRLDGKLLLTVSYTRRLECSSRPPGEPRNSHAITANKDPDLSPRYAMSNADGYMYLNESSVSDMLESKWLSSQRFKLEIVGLIFESARCSNQRLSFPALQSGVPCYGVSCTGWVGVCRNSAAAVTLA
jgi:hypothetical protein